MPKLLPIGARLPFENWEATFPTTEPWQVTTVNCHVFYWPPRFARPIIQWSLSTRGMGWQDSTAFLATWPKRVISHKIYATEEIFGQSKQRTLPSHFNCEHRILVIYRHSVIRPAIYWLPITRVFPCFPFRKENRFTAFSFSIINIISDSQVSLYLRHCTKT